MQNQPPTFQNSPQNSRAFAYTPIQTHPRRSVEDMREENEYLREAIRRIKQERQHELNSRHQAHQLEPQGITAEIQRRSQANHARINELQMLIRTQDEVIHNYRDRFREFEGNLVNIMKLDKNIHSRLVNPSEPSGVLQANVRNVILALNGKAPYDKVLKMIESIRI